MADEAPPRFLTGSDSSIVSPASIFWSPLPRLAPEASSSMIWSAA
jgi:hypothetical protein